MDYYIIEHPTAGVLREVDGTSFRFSWSRPRNDTEIERFFTVGAALHVLNRMAQQQTGTRYPKMAYECEVRSSKYDHDDYNGAWPIVARLDGALR